MRENNNLIRKFFGRIQIPQKNKFFNFDSEFNNNNHFLNMNQKDIGYISFCAQIPKVI